jgi:hypothetical protein
VTPKVLSRTPPAKRIWWMGPPIEVERRAGMEDVRAVFRL